MATDWSSLGWTPTLNFALSNERQLAQSSIADAGKGAEFKFNPTSMNAQLLAALGYTGQGLGSSIPNEFGDTGPQWSDDARTWLANNGYTVGVAHEPGSAPNGRPEYYGLVDRNGQFVAGQDQPTMTMSDSLMEQITPFLMLAGPFASAISTMEGLAAAGGAAGASGGAAGGAAGGAGGSISGGLGGAADGVTALGSSMSPEALGLTGGIAPGATTAEIAGLSSGIPTVAPSITDLALQGAMRGAVTGGVKGLATGQNPFESALQGAIGGGITGGIGGGVNAINPGGAGWVNSGITGGITTAIGGGNPLIGAVGGAAGSLANSGMSSLTQPTNTTGANMDLGGDWFSNWNPDSLNLTTDIAGNVLPVDMPSFSGGGLWNPEYGNLVSDWASGLFGGGSDSAGGGSSGLGSAILNGLKGAIGSASGAVGGGGNLAALIGAGLGAASGGSGATTQERAPWTEAQPFLKAVLGDAGNMLTNQRQQPYTPQQTQQYQQAFAGLDQARSALPGLLNWGQSAMQRQSTVPSYQQLFGGGLLNQPQQPTAQAGGAGGLLGNDDRIKALMARGRGLIG